MPSYLVKLKDGREFDVEADSPPTKEEIMSFLQQGGTQAQAPEDTGQGRTSSFISSVGRGAASIVPGVIGGTGYLTGSEGLVETANTIEAGINRALPVNPAYEDEFLMKAGQALGQVVPMIGTGGVAGAVGKSMALARGLEAGAAAAKGTQLAGRVMLGSGMLQGTRGGGQAAEQYGMEGGAAYARALLGGAIEGATEKYLFGMGSELSPIGRMLGSGGTPGATILRAAGTEGVEEGAAEIGGNLATTALAPSGVQTPGMFANAGEATALGAIAGGAMGGFNAMLNSGETPTVEGTPVVESPAPIQEEERLEVESAVEKVIASIESEIASGTLTQKPGETGAEFISRLGTQAEELAKSLETAAVQTAAANADVLPATAAALAATAPAPAATYNSEEAYQKARAEAIRNAQQSRQTPVAEPANDAEAAKTREFTQAEIEAKKKIGEGSESEVYEDGDNVIKVAEPYNQSETLAERVTAVLRAEKLLGGLTGLRYAGFRRGRNGVLNPVFSQRKLEGPSASRGQVKKLFEDNGWTDNGDGTFSISTPEGRVSTLSDLYDGGNVIVVEGEVIPRDVATIVEAPAQETPVGALETEASGVLLPEELQQNAVAVIYDLTSSETGEAMDLDEIEMALDNADRTQEKGRKIDWSIDRTWLPNLPTASVSAAKELLSSAQGRQALREEVQRKRSAQETPAPPSEPTPIVEETVPPEQPVPVVEEAPAASVVEDQFQKTENVVAPAGEAEVGLEMENIPEIPSAVAIAIQKEMAPDVNYMRVLRAFGKAEADRVASTKPSQAEQETLAQAKQIAKDNGWSWGAVVEKVRQQLGLDTDFLKPDSNEARQLAFFRKADKEAEETGKRTEAMVAESQKELLAKKQEKEREEAARQEQVKAERDKQAEERARAEEAADEGIRQVLKPEAYALYAAKKTKKEKQAFISQVALRSGSRDEARIKRVLENPPATQAPTSEPAPPAKPAAEVGTGDVGVPAKMSEKSYEEALADYQLAQQNVTRLEAKKQDAKIGTGKKKAAALPSALADIERELKKAKITMEAAKKTWMSATRAPVGGEEHNLSGKFYKGGQFMPEQDVLASTKTKAKKALEKFEVFTSPEIVQFEEGGEYAVRITAQPSGKKVTVLRTKDTDEAKAALAVASNMINVRLGMPELALPVKMRAQEAALVEAPTDEFGATNKIFTKKAKDKAVKNIGGQVNLGGMLDPAILKDVVIVGGFYVEGGVRSFAEFSAKLIEEFGAGIQKYLRPAYDELRKRTDIDTSGMDPEDGGETAPKAPTPAPKPKGDITLNPSEIEVIPEDMARAEADKAANNERWQKASVSTEPVSVLRRLDGSYKMIDGHHRLLGAMDRGETIEAKITQEKKLEPLKKSATAGTALFTQDEPLPPLKDKIEVIHFSRKPLTLAEKEKGTEYGEGADSVFGFGLYAMEPQDQKNWEGMDRLVLGPYKNELVIQAEKPLVVSPDTISDLMQQAKKEGVSFDSPWPFHTWLRSQTEGGKHDTIVVRGFDLSGDKTKKLKDQIEVRIAELWKPVFAPGKTSGAFINVGSYVQAIQQATQEIAGLSAEEFELISSLQNQVFVPPSKVGAVKPATKPLPTEPPPAEPPPPAAPAAGQPAPLEGPVSVANEPLNKVAEIIGLPRLETPLDGPYAWPQAWEDARLEFQQNSERGRELVSGMIARPRPPTPLEEVILLREGVTRTNAFNAAVDAQSKATEADQEDANRRVADATNALAEIQQASALMGTLSGRALNFRKMSAWMDFSLANMTTRLQGAKQKELTKEEIKDAQDTHKEILKKEEVIAKTRASAGAEAELTSIFEETFKEAVALVKKNANDLILQSRSAAKQGKSMKDFLVEKREEARKRIRLRGNNLNMGLNPADLFDHAVIMASYIAEGIVSIADLTAKMIGDFGPNVEKHIPQIKKEADALLEAEQQVFEAPEAAPTKTYAEQLVESQGEDLSDRWVYNRVKEWLVEQGEAGLKKDTKVLLDEVFKVITKEVNEFDPSITEQQLRDMFSGYGKVKFPNPEAAAVKLRQMRRLELLLDKLERARAGVAPLRAGLQRDETTVEERNALKLLNQTMKDLDIPRAPSGANIKTPLDAVKSRLKNSIEDLNKQIKDVKEGRGRTERPRKGVDYDPEATKLKEDRDALQKELDKLDPPRPPTVEERIQTRLKDLDKQIAKLKRRVKERDYQPKQNETPITEQIQVKTDERDDLNQTLKELRIEAEGQPVLTQEQVNEAAQKALTREIKALEKQISEQDFTPKEGLKPEDTPEYRRLRARVEALRKQRDQLKEDLGIRRKQKTDAELVAAAVKSVTKSVDELERRIRDLEFAAEKRPSKTPETLELKVLRDRRKELQKELQGLRKAEEDAAKDPVAEKIKADRKQLQRMIKGYEDRIAKGDFRKRPKIAKVYDDSLMQLEIDLDNIKAEWSRKVFEAHLASRPPLKRMLDTGGQVLNTSRAILTSFDLSAVLRQGGFIGLGNPFRAARNITPMLKAFTSDDVAKASLKRLKQRPNWKNYVTAGLYIAETDQTKMSAQEEAFMSRWIDKIPSGAKGLFLGSIVRGSQRAYLTFLNNLRADTFDALVNQLQKGPTPTREEMESIAYYINTATGRGDLGKGAINQGAVLLNTVFFAPRLVASRFQIIGGMPIFKATGRTKALILQEYAKFFMGAAIVYALAGLAQDDDDEPLEFDPRSSDFLKVRYGDTRVDPLGGLIQATVFVSRIVAGETKSAKGKITPIRDTMRLPNLFREVPKTDKVPYGGRNVFSLASDFARTKFSPAFGGAVDIVTGENVIGETVTPADVVMKMTVPMSFEEAAETLEAHGMPKGPALTILMTFGAGVMTYNDRK